MSGVVASAARGLQRMGPEIDGVIVLAVNDAADATIAAFLSVPTSARRVVLEATGPSRGKGANVRALLSFGASQDAAAVCLLDADVISGTDDWVPLLARSVLGPRPAALVTPVYRRNCYEGNTTNHIVRPFLAALAGCSVEQPIAGEFCLAGPFARAIADLPSCESVDHYGIDVFLSSHAALQGGRIHQVRLGRKIHNPGFPKILHMSQQVLDTLLRVLATTERPIGLSKKEHSSSTVDTRRIRPDNDLVHRYATRVEAYLREWDIEDDLTSLSESGRHEVCGVSLPTVDADGWCDVLAEAYRALAQDNFRRLRDHLVALYMCRVFTYWQEIAECSASEIERILQYQCERLTDLLGRESRGPKFAWSGVSPILEAGAWQPSAN